MKKDWILTKDEVENVMSRIKRGKPNECWNWTMRTNDRNRPIFSCERTVDGKRQTLTFTVQRLVLENYLGHTVSSRYIDVTCGNLLCCNPKHLKGRDLEARLWDNVKETESGCWEWQGAISPNNGYGVITIDGDRTKSVHRVAYELSKGEIPEDLKVLHKCNNRICINPEHLYVGTHNDNMRDMSDSNVLKGENNPQAILTESDVREIKKMIKSRLVTYNKIAAKYGVTRQAIKDIALGRTWAWLE